MRLGFASVLYKGPLERQEMQAGRLPKNQPADQFRQTTTYFTHGRAPGGADSISTSIPCSHCALRAFGCRQIILV